MALGTADGWTDTVISTLEGNEYTVSGDRVGHIVVRSRATGTIVTTLDMPRAVVRELFLLDTERVLAASQAGRAMLWDLPTGQLRETISARIYAFSHDGTNFITQTELGVGVHSYPGGKTRCQLAANQTLGIEQLAYSPDDKYLGVVFASGRPSDDVHYPGPNPVLRSTAQSLLFDLQHCLEFSAFTRLKATDLGVFSPDSRHYDLHDTIVEVNGRFQHGSWHFDLTTGTLTRLG